MSRRRRLRSRVLALCMTMLSSGVGLTAVGSTNLAQADPDCVNGGVYMVFARGSGEHLNDVRAHQFYWSLKPAIEARGTSVAWSEIGNEDGDVPVDMSADPGYSGRSKPMPDDAAEYPAVPVDNANAVNLVNGAYGGSVNKGTNELIAHLNDRAWKCPGESIVVGGYSQGADVVGWALQRTGYGSLNQTTRNHIGFVALYGDPKFNPGPLNDRYYRRNFSNTWWWVRGDDPGYRGTEANYIPNSGVLRARSAYVPSEFKGRFGSWCAAGDAMCAGVWPAGQDVHSNAYQGDQGWIAKSTSEIAYVAIQRRNALNPGLPPLSGPSFSPPDPNSGPPVAPPTTAGLQTTDNTRIALPSGQQYIWQRGVTIPISYSDAQRYDAEGNPLQSGNNNWNGPMNTVSLPPNTVIRPVGGNQQYLWSSGGQKLPVGDPATSACYFFSFPTSNPTGLPAVVPADWASTLPMGAQGQCSLGDGIRFTQSDTGPQQYISVRGAAFPVGYGDAVAYDGESDPYLGLGMTAGYVSNPVHAPNLPVNTVLRAAGNAEQFLWDGSLLHTIQNTGASACLLRGFPQNGVALVPPSWTYNRAQGAPAQCSLADGTRFTESGYSGLQQYISIRGAVLPLGTNDAVAYDQSGNTEVIDMPTGYVETHNANMPVNTILRGTGSNAQYLWDGTQLHSVLYPSTSACLLLEHPQNGVAVVPASWEATLPIGANQSCAYEGHLLQSPSGSVDYIKNGSRYHVTNWTIVNCLKGRAGTGNPIVVDSTTWNDYASSGVDAYCPYEREPGLNFVQESGDSTVWLVGPGTGGTPGVKRHVGSLCVPDPYTTQLKEYHVWTVPAGETGGHVQGADWWADGPKCQALPQG